MTHSLKLSEIFKGDVMKKIIILGAGGLGLEVADLIWSMGEYEIAGFLDDDPGKENASIHQISVLGTLSHLHRYNDVQNAVIAIANPVTKKRIAESAIKAGFLFPTLIHPSVFVGSHVSVGQGSILCAGTVVSTDVCLQDFLTINPQCGIGHESVLHSFSTLYWNVHIGGNTEIGEGCELGTHSCVLQGLNITNNVILGAGAVVVRNIEAPGTYAGVPVQKIRPGP